MRVRPVGERLGEVGQVPARVDGLGVGVGVVGGFVERFGFVRGLEGVEHGPRGLDVGAAHEQEHLRRLRALPPEPGGDHPAEDARGDALGLERRGEGAGLELRPALRDLDQGVGVFGHRGRFVRGAGDGFRGASVHPGAGPVFSAFGV